MRRLLFAGLALLLVSCDDDGGSTSSSSGSGAATFKGKVTAFTGADSLITIQCSTCSSSELHEVNLGDTFSIGVDTGDQTIIFTSGGSKSMAAQIKDFLFPIAHAADSQSATYSLDDVGTGETLEWNQIQIDSSTVTTEHTGTWEGKFVEDDGEPKGSVGLPILNVIKKNNLVNTAIYVVRIYGGVNLGIPGLIHAYSVSAENSIKDATLINWKPVEQIYIQYSYELHKVIISIVKTVKGRVISEDFKEKVIDNFDKWKLDPTSGTLHHVRSDQRKYWQIGDPTLPRMQLDYLFRMSPNIIGRLSGGILEEMFGGVGGEVLWRPYNSSLAIGLSAHRVRQRDYKQKFGFLKVDKGGYKKYQVVTGHLELYKEFQAYKFIFFL